jgi:hypothetical protein
VPPRVQAKIATSTGIARRFAYSLYLRAFFEAEVPKKCITSDKTLKS